MLGVAIVDQRVQPVDAFQDHVAAAPAVAAVRAPELDELLAAKAQAAVPAVAGAEVDLGLVEEFHGLGSEKEKGERPSRSPFAILWMGTVIRPRAPAPGTRSPRPCRPS